MNEPWLECQFLKSRCVILFHLYQSSIDTWEVIERQEVSHLHFVRIADKYNHETKVLFSKSRDTRKVSHSRLSFVLQYLLGVAESWKQQKMSRLR